MCLRVRGQISAIAHDWSGAERWFSEATRQAPSIPLAYTEWGAMRLSKGDVSGAIEELESATRVGPRFADPLELGGEALTKKGDYEGDQQVRGPRPPCTTLVSESRALGRGLDSFGTREQGERAPRCSPLPRAKCEAVISHPAARESTGPDDAKTTPVELHRRAPLATQ